MDAGNLIFLLLIVGGAFSMFFMHRGGGHGHGGGGMGGCGGHGHSHGGSSTAERREEEDKPILGKPGPHGQDDEHAATRSGRGGS
jgi:hypothetical protein